jgi:hypothetical protein
LGLLLAAATASALWTRPAEAQQQAQGFALDRLYTSAPGAGWFVMDTLDMHGGLGGVMALTTGYADDPLRVRSSDGSQRLTVVTEEALADFGLAATYDRFRLYISFAMPLAVSGNSGVVGAYQYTSPNANQPVTPSGVNPSTAPDALTDGRVGFDARLLGSAHDAFRLGAGAQLFVPTPNTPNSEYLSDGTFRAMGRLLFAGDLGLTSYAGQVGVHIRPLDESPTPGGPQGSELLFGFAAGRRLTIKDQNALALIVGPEVYGQTAFRSFFASGGTGVEGLLTGRVEGTGDDGAQVRVKLGVGGGLDAQFGTPEWRMVLGLEVFNRNAKDTKTHSGAPQRGRSNE